MLTPPDHASLLCRCTDFVRALRRAGVAADQASTIEFCRALALIDIGNPADFRGAARAIFVRRRAELLPFEQAFVEYWYGVRWPNTHTHTGGETEITGSWPRSSPRGADHAPSNAKGESEALYSDEETLAACDLATLDERQVEHARRMVRRFAGALPTRRTQRFSPLRRGRTPDFRRMLRGLSGRVDGDVTLRFLHRPPRRTRLVMLCDVSGSMRGYTEFLLELIYGMRRELPATEIAVFATRLTVISDLLDSRNIANSLHDVMARAADWGGGTDIGGCLRQFNRRYARTLLSSRTVVVLLSDGWDRGNALVMREEISQLRRHASRIIWLTPLLRFADYEPLTRGMRTAMPHIDLLLPCDSIDALSRFARTLRRQWA